MPCWMDRKGDKVSIRCWQEGGGASANVWRSTLRGWCMEGRAAGKGLEQSVSGRRCFSTAEEAIRYAKDWARLGAQGVFAGMRRRRGWKGSR